MYFEVIILELYKEILLKHLLAANPNLDAAKIVSDASYLALDQIRRIVRDESLDDKECFMRIEKIITVFEDIGSNGGTRHDF